MQRIGNVIGFPCCRAREGWLPLKGVRIPTSPLLGILFLMWVLAGPQALEPSWWLFEGSAPLFLRTMLWVMLSLVSLALAASSVGWCLAWGRIFWTGRLPRMYRARRFFRPLSPSVGSIPTAPTFHCYGSHPAPLTASFPIQDTLVNAVGLTSVARRLQ